MPITNKYIYEKRVFEIQSNIYICKKWEKESSGEEEKEKKKEKKLVD